MFHTVLIANRGEIARRIIRTLRQNDIRSVAVYSDGDASAPHVHEADTAVRLGPDPASASYLRVDAIVEAARVTGAQAIHPGYGFLSESTALAGACAEAGIVFIGPDIEALEIMGDKARARDHVAASGVPVVPGFSAVGMTDDEIREGAASIGYPLLIKPTAGGGGKGMESVAAPDRLTAALASARRIAQSSFGDEGLVIERLITRPRHIEVQVFGDVAGHVVSLGERECTLQRRHQKVIEEAPSPAIDKATRAMLAQAAVRAAESVSYRGAGTVEFLIDADAPEEFFFIEMNTRLQVEHPVTEAVTGLDLVQLQLDVAAGHPLPFTSDDLSVRGHAIEARVYAEAPARGFLPSLGQILRFTAPTGVRVDSAVETGSTVSEYYDPMIAKVIAHGVDRADALQRLDRALAELVVLGVDTNIAYLRALCQNDRVRAGDLDTGLIESLLPWTEAPLTATMAHAAAAASVAASAAAAPAQLDSARYSSALWTHLRGWRLGASAHSEPTWLITESDELVAVSEHIPAHLTAVAVPGEHGDIWVSEGGASARVRAADRTARYRAKRASAEKVDAAHDPLCRAPMPGTVVAVHVAEGQIVRAGDRLVSIEAMKMEHPILAPFDGVSHVLVAPGDQVRRDQSLARVTPAENISHEEHN